jgi:antitoxin (DNA-binding transcriptional repressor) of toxin-antitoxin stability system
MNERQMTVTEAARHFADLVNRTYYKGESTVLLRSGEAVAMLVPAGGSSQLGRDFATKWRRLRHLDADDAEDFGKSIEEARANLPMPTSPWD